jgi:hypothetical protein
MGMTICKYGEVDKKLTAVTFHCKTQREIIDGLRGLGMKAVRFSGIPGAWRCLVQTADGRVMQRDELRLATYYPSYKQMRQLGGVAGSHSEESVGELVAYPSPGVQREAKKPPINFMMLVLAFRMVMRVLGLSKHGNLTNDMGRILGYDK